MNLEMRGICKSFGPNLVLNKVGLTLNGGEILALLGENGAGKSTLMNILGGVVPRDDGHIELDGRVAHFQSPAASLGAGIAFIHQELNLINDLTVYENLYLGRELKGRGGLLDASEMERRTAALFDEMDISISPATSVGSLDASYKQIVEICRALLMNAEILIMDEPTTSLTEPEIQRVFDMMRRLKKRGVGIIFISHKLGEVLQICDRYAVLRDGDMVAKGQVAEITTSDLARFMVGHDVRTDTLSFGTAGDEVLRLEGLTNVRDFRDISLTAHAGEVLGITGLLGDGRSELMLAVFGEHGDYSGQVYLRGKPIRCKSSAHAIAEGIAYLPRNRKENGIIKDMSIVDNASAAIWKALSRFGFLDFARMGKNFANQAESLQIKFDNADDLITNLSGGNQQKIMLARWLSGAPTTLILDNPTQGVDVGAKEEIYDIILRLAAEGVAVIVLSSETQEIIRVCSRALVMYHGRLMGELSGGGMTEHEIMQLATGGGSETQAESGESNVS